MYREWLAKKGSAAVLVLLAVTGFWASEVLAGSGVPIPPRKQQQIQVSLESVPVPGTKPGSTADKPRETADNIEEKVVVDASMASLPEGREALSPVDTIDSSIPEEDVEISEDFSSRLLSFDSFRSMLGIGAEKDDSLPLDPALLDPSLSNTGTQTGIVIPKKKPEEYTASVNVYTSFEKRDPPPPRIKPMPGATEKMSEKNAESYREIFSAQTKGDIEKANEMFSSLTDYRLRGHVLYQRYLQPTAYTSSYDELSGWLDMYADHPRASKIYRLALARMPSGAKYPLRKPASTQGINGFLESKDDRSDSYISPRKRNNAQKKEVARIIRAVRRNVDRGAPTNAWKTLSADNAQKLLDLAEIDILRGYIAYGYLHAGLLDKAYTHAQAAVARSGNKVFMAGWVAGLISWRRGDYTTAAKYFEAAATSPYASGWTLSAAAYWASRAHMRTGNHRSVSYWLQKAADWPRTFYGLIATRALGRKYPFNWDIPDFTPDHQKVLESHPAAQRAMLLLQAGQVQLAEAELRQISADYTGEVETALLAYASHEGLPSFAMKLANAIPHPRGGFYDAALYPIVPWKPKEGYKVDLALLHAIIRQESRFDPGAESRSGATGLMQLMPSTASYVAGSRKYKSRDGRYRLKDPLVNIEIGQNYIEALLGQNNVNRDLFALAIAYNAGPGNLAKWKNKLSQIQDPLLFVESIPVAQTRVYVERVLANYWI
jgi:soluble lytic murein transglycosylase-like protein